MRVPSSTSLSSTAYVGGQSLAGLRQPGGEVVADLSGQPVQEDGGWAGNVLHQRTRPPFPCERAQGGKVERFNRTALGGKSPADLGAQPAWKEQLAKS